MKAFIEFMKAYWESFLLAVLAWLLGVSMCWALLELYLYN